MMPSNCTFCGLCCTLAVKLSRKDIEQIEKGSSRRREDFTVADADGKLLLKREKGWCTFLKRKGNTAVCAIYGSRPGNCRAFPGKRLCDLAENPLYNNLSDNEENKRIRQLLEDAPSSETSSRAIEKAQKDAAEAFRQTS